MPPPSEISDVKRIRTGEVLLGRGFSLEGVDLIGTEI